MVVGSGPKRRAPYKRHHPLRSCPNRTAPVVYNLANCYSWKDWVESAVNIGLSNMQRYRQIIYKTTKKVVYYLGWE